MSLEKRSWLLRGAALLGVAGIALAFTYSTSTGVDSNGVFELDGNALDDTTPGEDWSSVNPAVLASTYSGPAIATAFTKNGSDAFSGGQTKDIVDTSSWKWSTTSSPGKDTLTNAYAAAYNVPRADDHVNPNHLVIYFGADRFDNSGAAQLGFWFFTKKTTLTSNGFSPAHSVGDILVLVNFTTGGSLTNVQVLKWVGSGGDQRGGTLNSLTNAASACSIGSGSVATACATTNQSGPTQLYWSYTPKSGTPGIAPLNSFFEGGIDLTALLGSSECIASFMAETRSSPSVDATLQDFVGPKDFNVCGISVGKVCNGATTNATGDGYVYSYYGFVKNSPFGSANGVSVSDRYQSGKDSNGNPIYTQGPVYALGDLAPGAKVYFPAGLTFDQGGNPIGGDTFSSIVSGATNTVTATSTTPNINSVNVTATCPALQVSPSLSITKTCSVCLAQPTNPGPVVTEVTFGGTVCNTGNDELTGVTVTDNHPNASVTVTSTTLAKGACTAYTGSYIPQSLPITVYETDGITSLGLGFSDQTTASATSALGGTVTPQQSNTASCTICPAGKCAP